MLFAANGASFGFRSTLYATTGYHLATVIVTFVLGLGFSAIVGDAQEALLVIQVAGSLYVMWLAWKLWRAGSVEGFVDAKPIGFWDGAILLILNPKAYVIIALMFSQFLSVDSSLVSVAAISVIFTLNNLLAFTVWTLIGDAIARMFRSERNARILNRCLGLMLGLVGVWMLVS